MPDRRVRESIIRTLVMSLIVPVAVGAFSGYITVREFAIEIRYLRRDIDAAQSRIDKYHPIKPSHFEATLWPIKPTLLNQATR